MEGQAKEASSSKGGKTQVAGLEREHLVPAANVAARAFYDDPVFSWFFPDTRSRLSQLQWAFGCLSHIYAEQNVCFVGLVTKPEGGDSGASVTVKATAFCNPPGYQDSFLPYIRNGIGRLPLKGGPAATFKVLAALGRQGDLKEIIMGDCKKRGFWYLGILGVATDCQGQGIGSRMLDHFVQRADDDDLPAYLETARERNVNWYERYGFRVVYKEKASGFGPFIWYMRREAKSTDKDAGERLVKEIRGKITPMADARMSAVVALVVVVALFVGIVVVYLRYL